MEKYYGILKSSPTSFSLTPTAREILVRGKAVLGRSYTAIVEESVQEWGLRHLTPAVLSQYETMRHSFGEGTADAASQDE